MLTPKEWQEKLRGETSLESYRDIQADAMLHAAEIAKLALYAGGRRPEGMCAMRAIIEEIKKQNASNHAEATEGRQ